MSWGIEGVTLASDHAAKHGVMMVKFWICMNFDGAGKTATAVVTARSKKDTSVCKQTHSVSVYDRLLSQNIGFTPQQTSYHHSPADPRMNEGHRAHDARLPRNVQVEFSAEVWASVADTLAWAQLYSRSFN